MKMVSPYSTDIPLVPDTVPSPPSRVQSRKMSRDNGQLLARDEGTAKTQKVPEAKSTRETELARNQITSSVSLAAKAEFSRGTRKIKIAEHRPQGPRSECSCLSPWFRVASEYFRSSRWHFWRDLKRKCPRIMQLTQRIVSEIKSPPMRSRD